MRRIIIFNTILFFFISINLFAQDGLGDEKAGFSVSIGGEASASFVGYIDDFSKGADYTRLGEIFTGKLNFSAETRIAKAVVNLNLSTTVLPINIDEAYVQGFFGKFDITAGMRKIIWGKADNMGPLDVINPLDSTQIFTEMSDKISLLDIKIARPLVSTVFRFGDFSKLEAVFVPNFKPHHIAQAGEKWADSRINTLAEMPPVEITLPFLGPFTIPIKVNLEEPDTRAISYAQAGLRFTTTVGSADIGAQYYYGRLHEPAIEDWNFDIYYNTSGILPLPEGVLATASYKYNPFHQIGIDYAQDLRGFNTRMELAANITEDLSGDDGTVYNPSIAWSVGFDRELFWGINLNLQVNESIRLLQSKLGEDINLLPDRIKNDPLGVSNYIHEYDIEGGQPITTTRITAALTKKFIRDELELRAAVAWGIEDMDCAILPALIWTKDDIRLALSGGFFLGNSKGQLGQHKDSNFIKISFKYKF